jgi:hypothetical protein
VKSASSRSAPTISTQITSKSRTRSSQSKRIVFAILILAFFITAMRHSAFNAYTILPGAILLSGIYVQYPSIAMRFNLKE